MTDRADEQVLRGGHLSRVVRIGDTVRRSVGPWTRSVHALLDHLEARGFTRAPRALGFDDEGREVLSFIPGETVGEFQPWPSWVWSDEILARTGNWLREFHRAVSDFREPADAHWRMSWAPQGAHEIICHFDAAPYNLVRTPEGEVVFIDWDVAAPGTRILELAKVANSFSPVHDMETRERLQCAAGELNAAMLERCVHRVRVLLDAYGLQKRRGFVSAMLAAAEHTHRRIHRGAAEGDPALKELVASGRVDHVLETRDLFERHRVALERGIEEI